METVFLLYIRVLRQEYRTLLMLCTGLTDRAHELSLIWDGCDKLLRDYFSWQYRLQNVEFVSLLPRSGQAFHPKRMNKVSGRSCSGGGKTRYHGMDMWRLGVEREPLWNWS